MALDAYISALQVLVHDQAGLAFPPTVLTGFINEARQQTALEGECIRGLGLLQTTPTTQFYPCSAVAPPPNPAGVFALATPKSIAYNPGIVQPSGASPQVTLEKRNWDWFNFYWLGLAAPPPGPPRAWCPLNQGAPFLPQGGDASGNFSPVAGGSFYLNPMNMSYTVLVDGVWLPQNLTTETDPEAIPGPWTNAVPIYALYLAFLDARLTQLADDAMQKFELMMARSRGIVTPLREQLTFPGGLPARRIPGQAPPQRGAEAGPAPQGAAGGGGRR
jgi:hypothetical protein